ncbi:alpha/beta hydrolase [Hypericibacter sp.]|uniref:alpha/beta hydrolase n=1 Tax=Hypericibacter sp. TaxID=2705401 RepID=UPI003D6D2C2B
MCSRPAAEFDWLHGDVRDLRERYAGSFRVTDRGAGHWQTMEAGGQPLRLLIQRPARTRRRDRAILYFHGGGWIVGSPATHAEISRALCDRTGLTVISVDYRLAPEHVAPAPIEDGLAALAAALSAEDWGHSQAVLCGDSAGAAIALAVERHLDAGTRRDVLGVGSFYGGFGGLDSPSLRRWGSRERGMDAACLARYWRLANAPGEPSPYAGAALATPSSVPVYLLAGSHDPVLDDSLALARAYEGCGRTFTLDLVEGEGHGFLHGVEVSAAATAAINRVSHWINGL